MLQFHYVLNLFSYSLLVSNANIKDSTT